MSFGTLTTPTAKPITDTAVNYYVTIGQLSSRTVHAVGRESQTQTTFSSVFSGLHQYIPFIALALFVLVFIIAFYIQFTNGLRGSKVIISALMVAIFAASIPATNTYVQQGTRQQARAGPEDVPRNVRVAPSTATSAVITWETDAERLGVVRLGKKPLTDESGRAYIADNQTQVRIHRVEVKDLKKRDTYEFEIYSGNTWYDNGGKYIQFTF